MPVAIVPVEGLHPVDPALAAMMTSLDFELGCDGLLVTWHEHDRPARALFGSGLGQLQSDNERDMIEAASAAADTDSQATSAFWVPVEQQTKSAIFTSKIVFSTGTAVIVSLYRRAGDALRFSADETATRLLPMVRAFLQMWTDREGTASRLRGMTAVLDRMDVATILLNKQGYVLFTNAAADHLIGRSDGLRRTGRMLSGTRLADTLRLQAAIEHVINVDRDERDTVPSPVVALHRKMGRPLLAAIGSVEGALAGSDAVAIVTLYDPSRSTDEMLVPACKMYGLTPVETRLACLLAAGASLSECAAKMRLQEQTARSYLKQLFAKTDTNRQGELISLLLSSAVRLIPGLKTSFI